MAIGAGRLWRRGEGGVGVGVERLGGRKTGVLVLAEGKWLAPGVARGGASRGGRGGGRGGPGTAEG